MEALLENTPLVGGIGLVLGLLIGMLIMRLLNGPSSSKAELQAKLDAVEAEFETHKQSVNNHFETTSELVNDLTESYVKVYKHLSLGATALSGAVDVSHRLTLDEAGSGAAIIEGSSDSGGDSVSDSSKVVADEAIEETLTELEATARDLGDDSKLETELLDQETAGPRNVEGDVKGDVKGDIKGDVEGQVDGDVTVDMPDAADIEPAAPKNNAAS